MTRIPSVFLDRVRNTSDSLGYKFSWVDQQNGRLASVSDTAGHLVRFGAHPLPMWPFNSGLATETAFDKELSLRLLADQGVATVPTTFSRGETPNLELPWVAKPNRGHSAQGLSLVHHEEGWTEAYQLAKKSSSDDAVLVQPLLTGADQRLYSLDDEFLLALTRQPSLLRGDGLHTWTQLFAKVFPNPDEAMALSRDSYRERWGDFVPKEGELLAIHPVSNRRFGGAVKLLPEPSDRHRRLAETVPRILGLRFAAIDLIQTTEGLTVLEVNGNPGIESVFQADPPQGEQLMERLLRAALDPRADSVKM